MDFAHCHHLTQFWQCDSQKTRNTTRPKCCACHAKWLWKSPKCCACHEKCTSSFENDAKVLPLSHRTTSDTLWNMLECHEVPRLPHETRLRNVWNLQKWLLLQHYPKREPFSTHSGKVFLGSVPLPTNRNTLLSWSSCCNLTKCIQRYPITPVGKIQWTNGVHRILSGRLIRIKKHLQCEAEVVGSCATRQKKNERVNRCRAESRACFIRTFCRRPRESKKRPHHVPIPSRHPSNFNQGDQHAKLSRKKCDFRELRIEHDLGFQT